MTATNRPEIVDRDTWQQSFDQLLRNEKAHTRAGDALAAERRLMPMTPVSPTTVVGEAGEMSLADVFEGRNQLVAYHFMWHPGQPTHAQCEGCTMSMSQISDGARAYLAERDTTFAVLCTGPWEEIAAYRAFMGWTMPWYSTAAATDPGATGFGHLRFYLRDGDTVYQTYEVDYRGTEVMDVTYGLLDRTTYGRQEPWEDSPEGWPKKPMGWWRRDGRPVAQWLRTDEPAPVTGTTTSADGTEIAWTRQGSGPDLVMIHCVATSRERTPQPTLPDALAEHFTVWTYDRRGTGASGDGGEYAVEREIEDLAAMVGLASGPVTVYGFSSGATLALLAAAGGVRIDRLTLLEPPLLPDADPSFALRDEAQRRIDDDVDAADQWYNTEIVGVPPEVLAELPPRTDADRRNTRTIVHELEFLPGTSAERFAGVEQPTLLIASDATAPIMYEIADALVSAMPDAERVVLPGEWHGVDDVTLTREIVRFTKRPAHD